MVKKTNDTMDKTYQQLLVVEMWYGDGVVCRWMLAHSVDRTKWTQDVETSPSRKQSQEVSPHAKLLLPSTTRMSGIRSIQIDAAMLMIWCSSVVCCRVCCCCQVLLLFLFPAVISTYVGIHTWSDLDFTSTSLLQLDCLFLAYCFPLAFAPFCT